MAFVKVERSTRGGLRGEVAPDVAICKYSRNKTSGHAQVQFSKSFAARMGLAHKDKMSVAIGTDEDSGIIALTRSATGFSLSKSGNTGNLRIFVKGAIAHVKSATLTPCKFSVVGDTVYVQVPPRFLDKPSAEAPATLRFESNLAAE